MSGAERAEVDSGEEGGTACASLTLPILVSHGTAQCQDSATERADAGARCNLVATEQTGDGGESRAELHDVLLCEIGQFPHS